MNPSSGMRRGSGLHHRGVLTDEVESRSWSLFEPPASGIATDTSLAWRDNYRNNPGSFPDQDGKDY